MPFQRPGRSAIDFGDGDVRIGGESNAWGFGLGFRVSPIRTDRVRTEAVVGVDMVRAKVGEHPHGVWVETFLRLGLCGRCLRSHVMRGEK